MRPTIPCEIFAVVVVSAVLVTATVLGAFTSPAGATPASANRDQIPPLLDDVATSAPVALTDVVIQADISDSLPPAPTDALLFYSTDAQSTWSSLTMSPVAGSPGTWGTPCPMPDGELTYYVLSHSDTAATFTGPVNDGNAFPPPANRMVDPADEFSGDGVDMYTLACDLTGARFGYSDTHYYATLSNVTGTWPLSGGIIGPWYVYSALIGNPDAPVDSVALAMVYANVPILAQTGLYWVDSRDSSFVRIGDIDATVAGGQLHMRCARADLEAHPDFGPDNPSGFYGVGAGTATSVINGDQWANDRTNVYAFYMRTDSVAPGANTAPSLTNPMAAPAGGGAPDTLIRFSVTYTDPDGHLAAARDLHIDGDAHAMDCPGPDRDYASGVHFELDVPLSPGEHTYFYSFGDGDLTVATTPAVVNVQTGVPDEPVSTLAFRSAWPQPCASELRLAFSLGARRAGRVDIYNTNGRLVRKLWSGGPGDHETTWDMRNDAGERVASGVYFAVLKDDAASVARKVVVLR